MFQDITLLCVEAEIVSDEIVEEDEFFNVTVTSTDSVDFVGGPARVIITDDDSKNVTLIRIRGVR